MKNNYTASITRLVLPAAAGSPGSGKLKQKLLYQGKTLLQRTAAEAIHYARKPITASHLHTTGNLNHFVRIIIQIKILFCPNNSATLLTNELSWHKPQKMKIIFIIVIITFAGFFCKKINFSFKSKTFETDTFIFGVDGGLLAGNFTYFKIENEKVYRNVAFAPGQETIVFNTNPLLNNKYLLTKILKENFPDYLLSHPNQTFGCPNCTDQGAIHIEMEHNGILNSWDIDTDINRQPAEIRPYVKKLIQIVSQL